MKIDKELIGPAATIAAAMLSKLESEHAQFTPGIIASAFEDAYFTLLDGIARVEKEIAHRNSSTSAKKPSPALGAVGRSSPTRFTVR